MNFSTYFRDQLPPAVADEFDYLYAGLKGFFNVSFQENGQLIPSAPGNNLVPIGSVLPFAGSVAPAGWALCDGAQVNRVTYKALFAVIGNLYGNGDGSTTFNLPDLRQRFPLGKAASGVGATLAATGGAIDHTHSVAGHTHSIPGLSVPSLSVPGLSVPGLSVPGLSYSGTTGSPSASTGAAGQHTHTVNITSSGPSNTNAGITDGADHFVPDYAHSHDSSGVTGVEPDHTHSVSVGGSSFSGTTGTGTTGTGTTGTGSTGTGTTGTGTTGSASGTTGANNPPYIVLNYIILLKA